MVKPAPSIAPEAAPGAAYYEQPLSERMRTLLRLEFLYQQILFYAEQEVDWATRATVSRTGRRFRPEPLRFSVATSSGSSR